MFWIHGNYSGPKKVTQTESTKSESVALDKFL